MKRLQPILRDRLPEIESTLERPIEGEDVDDLLADLTVTQVDPTSGWGNYMFILHTSDDDPDDPTFSAYLSTFNPRTGEGAG